jgi:lysozyme
MIHGLDISNHQGNIDWTQASAGQQFAIAKATEGITFKDAWFVKNWAESKQNGLVRGAYHYARVQNDPIQEADHFLSVMATVTIEPGDLVALDIEDAVPGVNIPGWSLRWLNHVTNALGFRPLLYSYQHFVGANGFANAPALAQFPLWYASYRVSWPPIPAPWPDISIWQHTSSLHVPGIVGNVDGNKSRLTVQALKALGKAGGFTDDEMMEWHYQRDPEAYGAKRYAATLTRDYYTGKLLRTDRALIAPDGRNLAQSNAGNLLDDWEQDQEAQGALVKH